MTLALLTQKYKEPEYQIIITNIVQQLREDQRDYMRMFLDEICQKNPQLLNDFINWLNTLNPKPDLLEICLERFE